MDMMAYHGSDDITIDLMAATIDMMTGLPISNIHILRMKLNIRFTSLLSKFQTKVTYKTTSTSQHLIQTYLLSSIWIYFNPSYIVPPQMVFCFFSRKFFPATYDETLCKFLLCTYEDSHNSFWSKILFREHVEYVYVAWVENINFKNCNFWVLRGIFEGLFIK